MNIYEKLIEMRSELQGMNVKKTGNNNGRRYYELADFLPVCNDLCRKYKIISLVSFNQTEATLTMVDAEKPSDIIPFCSPFGSAALKGCHEVQNIGAVETYQRRYLYLVAFEIVEFDALDSSDYYKDESVDIRPMVVAMETAESIEALQASFAAAWKSVGNNSTQRQILTEVKDKRKKELA